MKRILLLLFALCANMSFAQIIIDDVDNDTRRISTNLDRIRPTPKMNAMDFSSSLIYNLITKEEKYKITFFIQSSFSPLWVDEGSVVAIRLLDDEVISYKILSKIEDRIGKTKYNAYLKKMETVYTIGIPIVLTKEQWDKVTTFGWKKLRLTFCSGGNTTGEPSDYDFTDKKSAEFYTKLSKQRQALEERFKTEHNSDNPLEGF